jgi:hypothetical protein
MESTNFQGKEIPGFGRCIYCGSPGKEDGLRDEHIIPFSLGGNTIIKHASCRKCEAITSYLDGYLARNIFYEHRLHIGAPTRRPKNRPPLKPIRVNFLDGERTFDLPISDRPHMLILPVWGDPGFIRGAPPSSEYPHHLGHGYGFVPDTMNNALGLRPDQRLTPKDPTNVPINLDTFARAIAKIAHCHAVAALGIDGFRPLVLPKIVLGTYNCLPYFIGASINDPPPPREDMLHLVTVHDLRAGQLRLTVISVRLFSNLKAGGHGVPIYNVLTGPRKVR